MINFLETYITSAYHYISGNAPDPSKETVRRENVLVILHNKSNNTFAVLDREKLNRKSWIMGGIDGQDIITAAQREVEEEAWYIDLKHEVTLQGESHGEYFAAHKWISRYSIEHCVVFNLLSDKKHTLPLDDDNHALSRLPFEQVEAFLLQVPGPSSNAMFWYEYTQQIEKLEHYLNNFTRIEKDPQL